MLILLLFLLSMFIRIDALGEAENKGSLIAASVDLTEEQIAITHARQSLDRMLIRREEYYSNIPLDQIPDDLYDQRTNRLLDIYSEARDEGRGDDVARLVLQAYNRLRPILEAKGVQLPQLYELDNPPTINVSLFQRVGMTNGQPSTDLDKDIRDIFIDDILRHRDSIRAASVENIFRPFAVPQVSARARTVSPSIGSSASQQLNSAAEWAHALDRVSQSLSQSPHDRLNRSDILNLLRGSLENQGAARGASVEPLALPEASLQEEQEQGERKRPREEENDQQSKKRKLDSDASIDQNFNPPNRRNDDDNDDDGGIAV